MVLLLFHVRAHSHTWSFSHHSPDGVSSRGFAVVCGFVLCSGCPSARMRTRGVFRTWRRSVDHHLYLRSSAVVLFLRVVSARMRIRGVFYTCRAAASILVCGASPGPLLGFSWAYPESSWAPQGLSWASPGPLLGPSWASPGFSRLVAITKGAALCRKFQQQSGYVYKGLVSYCKIQHQMLLRAALIQITMMHM